MAQIKAKTQRKKAATNYGNYPLVPVHLKMADNLVAIDHNFDLVGYDPRYTSASAPNIYELRSKLLSAKRPKDFLDFLNYGNYVLRIGDRIVHPIGTEHLSDQLRGKLEAYRDLLNGWLRGWKNLAGRYDSQQLEYLCRGTGRALAMTASMAWDVNGKPRFTIFARDAIEAVVATVHIDKLRKMRFRRCKRKDCSTVFESRKGKSYCSQYCAHLESVRRTRKQSQRKSRKAK